MPGAARPTGHRRVHGLVDQSVSKNSLGLEALEPKSVAYSSRTAARRFDGESLRYARALSPPMNPKTTPAFPSGGESSKVALTGPFIESACPVSPSSRQNGVS